MAGYIGNDPAKSSVRIARQTYTTTGSQTDFTFSAGYDPGYIEIYVNGVRQTEGTNFTANDGSVFSILNGIGAGNTVTAAAYKAFNVASVSLSEVTDVDDLSVTGQITGGTGYIGINTFNADGSVTTGIITASSFVGDGSALTGVASTDNIITGTAATFNSVVKVGTGITLDATSGIVTATGVNVTGVATASKFDGNATGLTGTPDLTIRNITGVAATFTGVLTYEDVTNVDSVGVVTARGGFEIGASGVGGTITAVGNAEIAGIMTATEFHGSGANLTNLPASGDSNDITASLFI